MSFESKEREWTDRTKRFLKAELKRADVTYEELARRLREHGLEETESSVTNKLRAYPNREVCSEAPFIWDVEKDFTEGHAAARSG